MAPEINQATTDLVLVAGGIAITFCWPLFVAALASTCHAATKGNLTSCKLVWIVRHESTLSLLQEAFSQAVEQLQNVQAVKNCRFSMDIYITSTSGLQPASLASSRSVSTRSIRVKPAVEKPRSGEDQASLEDLELSSNAIELPKLLQIHQDVHKDQKHQGLTLSDGVNGDLIRSAVSPVVPRCCPPGSLSTWVLDRRRRLVNEISLFVSADPPACATMSDSKLSLCSRKASTLTLLRIASRGERPNGGRENTEAR